MSVGKENLFIERKNREREYTYEYRDGVEY